MSTYWQQIAAEDLKSYTYRKQSLAGMADEIATLKGAAISIRAVRSDAEPVAGGTNGREDAIIDNIVRRDELMVTMAQVEVRCRRIEAALEAISDKDRTILTRLFIEPQKGAIERLCNELNYDKATVYRHRTNALRNFTLSMYGRTES